MTNYDPIDLVFLANGWTQGAVEFGCEHKLSVTRAMDLEDAARMLARLYAEAVQDEWPGEWAYDVAEPLGIWIGRTFGKDGDMPPLAEIEAAARDIVIKAMAAAAKVMATQPQDAGMLDDHEPGER